MTVIGFKQLVEHNPLSMSIEEASRRKRKGYEYVPDIPIEEPPLPLKRERKKVKYSDYINPVKTLRKSPTRKRSPVRKYKKARPAAKKQKLSEAEEFLQTLNDKKREIEEKLHQINADLADVTQKLYDRSDEEEEEAEEQPVKEESNDVIIPDQKEPEIPVEEEGANKLPEGDQSRKEVPDGIADHSTNEEDNMNVDTKENVEKSPENIEIATVTTTNKATPKKSPKKGKRKRSTKKRKEPKERKSPDPKRVTRVTRTSEALSVAELQAANQIAFSKILNMLMKHRYSAPFLQPVDPIALNIPDYPTIIKNPMDFGTIKTKLENHSYLSPREFADDVTLVFTNACTYNQPGSDVYIMANTIHEVFVKKMNTLLVKQGLSPLAPANFGLPISRAPILYQPVVTPQGYNELKKSVDSLRKELQNLRSLEKAPKVVKVEKEPLIPMTRDEKRKLSNDINKLSSEHLGSVVKIIKQKMPIGDVDEIVIDIDSLDTATLRDLEQYVLKIRRKGSRRGRRGSQTMSNESKLEQAKKTQELTEQRLEDVQKRLEELKRSNEPNFLNNSSTIAFANPMDDSIGGNVQNEIDDQNNSEGDSESASDTDSDASSSESASDNESGSESETQDNQN